MAKHIYRLETESSVLSFDNKRHMKVNYNTRLIGLIREVSVLSMMGHKIHPDIVRTAKHAQKFMKQAKALDEVAYYSRDWI